MSLVLLVGVPAWLGAAPQEGGDQDRIQGEVGAMLTANFKLGPFHISPLLPVAGGIGSVPNTRQQDNPERNDIDGFISTTPVLRAALPFGANHTVRMQGGFGRVWYRQLNSQDRSNYTASGAYSYAGSRLQLSLAESYFRGSYSRFAPLDVEAPPDPTLETDNWVSYTSTNTTADVSFSMTERLKLTVGARDQAVRYREDEGQAPSDSNIFGVETSLDTPVTAFSSVGVVYEWSRVEDPDASGFRNADTQALGLRYMWDTPRSLSGEVRAGYRRIDPDDATVIGYRGWNYAATFAGEPFERLQASLQLLRNTFRSSYANNLYGVRQGGGATLAFAASRHFRFRGSVRLYVQDYPEQAATGGGGMPAREDVLTNYSVGATWSIARSHTINFAIGKAERNSTLDEFDRVGLLLDFGYFFVY